MLLFSERFKKQLSLLSSLENTNACISAAGGDLLTAAMAFSHAAEWTRWAFAWTPLATDMLI